MGLAAFNRARRQKARREVEAAAPSEERQVQETKEPDAGQEAPTSMNIADLREVAEREGVDLTGLRTKAEIVAAIREYGKAD